MSQQELNPNPPFCSMVRASGLAEVWTHSHEDVKFNQFGWRCTNKENGYSIDTLVGNWSEERFGIDHRKKAEALPSQYGHYYNPVYNSSYNRVPKEEVPEVLKHLNGRHPHAHPRHQPEFDSDKLKTIYNSWKTTQRADYIDPKVRQEPLNPPSKASTGSCPKTAK